MRWIHAILSLLLLVPVVADEPAAAPSAASGAVDLGGRFAPTARTTVKWETRTELTAGKYNGIRGIVPMEGKLDKTDEREILSWDDIPADHLEAVLDSHLPVCPSCNFAESFRREFPERVIDRDDPTQREKAYH